MTDINQYHNLPLHQFVDVWARYRPTVQRSACAKGRLYNAQTLCSRLEH